MGYCMDFRDAKFSIANEDKQMALEAIKALKKGVNEKGSGFSSRDADRNYAWVDTDEFMNADTLEKAIQAWRWETESDASGNINSIHFDGEKLGDDLVLFEAIAPYVKKGSFIEMGGEDGYIWRWVFNGKDCVKKAARMVFED